METWTIKFIDVVFCQKAFALPQQQQQKQQQIQGEPEFVVFAEF